MTERDWSEHPEAKKWLAHARDELVPMIADSALTMTLVPDEPDPKVAVELGYSILLDKPIVLVVPEGRTIPEHLARVADMVIPMPTDVAAFTVAMNEAMVELEERGLL